MAVAAFSCCIVIALFVDRWCRVLRTLVSAAGRVQLPCTAARAWLLSRSGEAFEQLLAGHPLVVLILVVVHRRS